MNRLRWFAVVVGLQAVLLLGWAGYHEVNRANAPTILLETAPVDPRDLLRGDFMILNYKISRVPRPRDDGPPRGPYGGDIWVSLRKNERFYEVAATSWTEPKDFKSQLIHVRGQVRGPNTDQTLRVDYGIEKYFVPEGKGTPRFKEMIVEAIVDNSHRLGLKRMLLDGQPYP